MSYLFLKPEEEALLREQCIKAGIAPDRVLAWVDDTVLRNGLLENVLEGRARIAGFGDDGPEFTITDAGIDYVEKELLPPEAK